MLPWRLSWTFNCLDDLRARTEHPLCCTGAAVHSLPASALMWCPLLHAHCRAQPGLRAPCCGALSFMLIAVHGGTPSTTMFGRPWPKTDGFLALPLPFCRRLMPFLALPLPFCQR